MDTENIKTDGCPQRDSAEHKGYVGAHRSFKRIWKERDSAAPKLLEEILDKDNLNRNEFDWEFQGRDVPCIRYADDIVLLAKSERASKRLLESSIRYLEGHLKLKVNR